MAPVDFWTSGQGVRRIFTFLNSRSFFRLARVSEEFLGRKSICPEISEQGKRRGSFPDSLFEERGGGYPSFWGFFWSILAVAGDGLWPNINGCKHHHYLKVLKHRKSWRHKQYMKTPSDFPLCIRSAVDSVNSMQKNEIWRKMQAFVKQFPEFFCFDARTFFLMNR